MPRSFCPACLTHCRVDANQLGHRVICPECGSKFTAVHEERRPLNPIGALTGVLIVVALGVVTLLAYR
jgi:predicted Zn finger-like uncharacterized protein